MLKFLKIILTAVLFVPFPIVVEKSVDGTFVFGVDYAFAEKGRGRGGDEDDDDRDEDDDDRDDDDDDDRDDDDSDDDNSGRGSLDDDRDDDDDARDDDRNDRTTSDDDRDTAPSTAANSNTASSGGGSGIRNSRGQAAIANLHLRYANGWDEQILNGTYRLVDPQGRTVADRRATPDDLARMRALVGQ